MTSAVRVLLVVSVAAAALGAQEQKLGTIHFPNSGNAAAQAPFVRGMLLYYSFEYPDAAAAFREAQKADPSFALAFGGEALTYTHQVWNEQNVEAGRAALARLAPTRAARRAKAGTVREQQYMDLAETLYGEGSKQQRDTMFNAVAERLSNAFPGDDEAKVFHALGLLGLNQSVRDIPNYMQAGAIAEDVLRRNPDHPAAAHFVIHAFDDPVHAPLGLWAARAYSKIAPAAMHAQHMTSHIFVAMGMWDEVISQNVIASQQYQGVIQAGHYPLWLEYGYLQAGRYVEAKSLLQTALGNRGKAVRRGEAPALVMMRAHMVVDAKLWKDDVATWKIPVPEGATWAIATDSFVAGVRALRSRDEAAADRISMYLTKAAAAAPATERGAMLVLEKELRAALFFTTGRDVEGLALAREAATAEEALPLEFGPPVFVLPTAEQLGEFLLTSEKFAEAQVAFQRSLARTPGRTRSLLGLARAASGAGDKATAESAVAQLRSNWHAADKGLPELAELTKLVATTNK
jgi:Tfp pilus assembly protein PilF